MTQRSMAATEVARLLWLRAAADASDPGEVVDASARMCTQLRGGLDRWVGVTGYRALLDRAVGLARQDHPALSGCSCYGGEEPVIAAAVEKHGPDQVAAGMVAVVGTVIDLLGRIIGEEMALRLVEQTGTAAPRAVVSTESKGGLNGRAR